MFLSVFEGCCLAHLSCTMKVVDNAQVTFSQTTEGVMPQNFSGVVLIMRLLYDHWITTTSA
eukprot:m.180146 g.180146  ORF g.180146 m.180146 type:complete len:61 (-) comp15492_c0_seq5:2420-2602(-)